VEFRAELFLFLSEVTRNVLCRFADGYAVMSVEHLLGDEESYWQTGITNTSLQHSNISNEELIKLQLAIIRNFTRLYGSAAIARGQLQGDVLRHPL